MINLDIKLTNIHQILSDLEVSFKTSDNLIDASYLEEKLRRLNFEANDFFENLTLDFNIANKKLPQIIQIITNLLEYPISGDLDPFGFKINLLNLQIFIPIHLLFLLTSNSLRYQIDNQNQLELLVDLVHEFEDRPVFDTVSTMEEKQLLDNYFRIFGSMGDLYYLLCSNLNIIKKDYLIKWTTNCFKQFFLLDQALEKFDPLIFYKTNNLPVEDLYREIVGHYTILGNTNATNLLEFVLSLDNQEIIREIQFKPYISSISINELENKIQSKIDRIKDLLQRVEESKNSGDYFSAHDDPLNVISFRLMNALEKYFQYTKAKILCYKKEYNQLQTPSSTELNNALELCENWLDTTLSLTEENENILDTPFGGLFNSVFLEYLLITALEDGKKISENKTKKPLLEVRLEKYKTIYLNDSHTAEQISDFIYFKTYSQIYVYSVLGNKETLIELIDECYSFLSYLDKKPLLKLNTLFLIIVLEISLRNKPYSNLVKVTNQILELIDPKIGLHHLEGEVTAYLTIIRDFSENTGQSNELLEKRVKPKILDINSWLIPNLDAFIDKEKKIKFISFNQMSDRILFTN